MDEARERPTQAPTAVKAYKNEDFLNSTNARLLRIQCEFEEPRVRLQEHGIENIVMIFGSARSMPPDAYRAKIAELKQKAASDPSAQPQLVRYERMAFLCRYHEETVKLARLITEFSRARESQGLPSYTVGTGAGPGMMEAANEGAHRARGRSVGFGISLPFEKGLNPYVTPELGFEFHYFFTRKFWMAYKCMGLVVAPGGYGTADELFEILTLIKTGKIRRRLPVILFGLEYWNQVLNLDAMATFGVLEKDWSNLVFTCDCAEEAFDHLKKYWLAQEAAGVPSSVSVKPLYKKMKEVADAQVDTPDRVMIPKAYKNTAYIKSSHTRVFRIQCEFEETRHRLEAQGISNTLMFVGSSSVRSYEGHLRAITKAQQENNKTELDLLSRQQPLLKFHEVARELARRITAWSRERERHGKAAYHVATGGGPGLMESANEGAWEAGGKSLGISGGDWEFNRYVTPELAFLFHYFFTRKFWMAFKCMGIVALPGGFGTCDELFEIVTLMQTGKIKRKMPVVLVGVEYWNQVIRWQKMADYGMISDLDVTQLYFTDSAVDAYRHITAFWENEEIDGKVQPSPKKQKLSS